MGRRLCLQAIIAVFAAFVLRSECQNSSAIDPYPSIQPTSTGKIPSTETIDVNPALPSSSASIETLSVSPESGTTQPSPDTSIAPAPTSSTVTSTTTGIKTTAAPTTATPPSTQIWDKVVRAWLGEQISFIVMVAAAGLCLILLFALIITCCRYHKLKKKTKFPKDLIINNDSAWINSNDDLLMWERNLRATEVNPGPTTRPANDKRI